MRPAKSRGHALSRRVLGVALVCALLLAVEAYAYSLGVRGLWLSIAGMLTLSVGGIATLGAVALYGLMFAAWIDNRRGG